MIFFHIIEDFHVQGKLAHMKQRVWWMNQPTYTSKYKYDYFAVLLAHGFEWSIFIHIPIIYYIGVSYFIIICIVISAIMHAIIDHLKCNLYASNLCQDQLFHILQIILVVVMMYVIYG